MVHSCLGTAPRRLYCFREQSTGSKPSASRLCARTATRNEPLSAFNIDFSSAFAVNLAGEVFYWLNDPEYCHPQKLKIAVPIRTVALSNQEVYLLGANGVVFKSGSSQSLSQLTERSTAFLAQVQSAEISGERAYR
jgi:hypothetical protein